MPKTSEKFRLDRKIDFQNTFYTKCINVIIDSIGPLIILRIICCGYSKENLDEHPKHMFELMDKKKIAILCKIYLLNWPYDILLKVNQLSMSETVYLQCL